jgi:hypothetical protein
VSIGLKAAIEPHLKVAEIDMFEAVWGQDCPELIGVDYQKGPLIKSVMDQFNWSHDECIFLDDTMDHIKLAEPVCKCIHVRGSGMSMADINAVRTAAGLDLDAAPLEPIG